MSLHNYGSFIKDLSTEIKKHIDVNDDMLLNILLPTMSSVLGTKVMTNNGARNKLRTNLWSLIIAPSGVGGKSTTLEMVKKSILEKLLNKLQEEYVQEKKAHDFIPAKERLSIDEPRKTSILGGQGSTFQGMIKSLQHNSHGLLYIYDEASEFLNKMNKDHEAKASFTSLYEQDSYGKGLVGSTGKGENIWIDNPFISLIAITNPHWFFNNTSKQDFLSGYINRFSIVYVEELGKLIPFKSQEVHQFEKFQDVSLKIWNYLADYSNKALHIDVSEIEEQYASWHVTTHLTNEKKYHIANNFDEQRDAFIIRQKTAALKYAVIIQMFDTFYSGETLSTKLQPHYLDIGIQIAERAIRNIYEFEDINNSISKNEQSDKIKTIASRVISFLRRNANEEMFAKSRSDLTNSTGGLSAKNFYDVMEYVAQDTNVLFNMKEFQNRLVPRLYYEETDDVDKYLRHGIYEYAKEFGYASANSSIEDESTLWE